jgi:hypothetical protein
MKIALKIIKWSIGILILFILLIISLVRFTDGTISSGDKVILGYDEERGIFQLFEKKTYDLGGIDGPYIVGDNLFEISKDNKLQSRTINRKDTIAIQADNLENDLFYIQLKDSITSEPEQYELPQRLIAISDIEGNFNGFSSFLKNNNVIDNKFNWVFGKGHLVLIGDFVDRGKNVTQVLWLIYKLENQAQKHGGKVHYILGNHEIMNLQGNSSYNQNKYKRVAQLISKKEDLKIATQYLYSHKTELGKWLRSKNVIEKIGDNIFVHGGVSPEILKYRIPIFNINQIARENWDKDLYNEEECNKVENFVTGKKGVYWYRGLATDYKDYNKITQSELNKVLDFYAVNKIIFGHTLKKDIAKEFNGQLIGIDVKHGQEKNSGKTKGVLIENGIEYKIDDNGIKTKL